MASQWTECEEKMISEGCNGAAIAAFKASYEKLVSGQSPFIAESAIEAAGDDKVPTYESIAESTTVDNELLSKVVVVKLNGGLGTGMGLDKAKSLLEVKNGQTFLDFTAKQIVYMRKQLGQKVRFLLMNSFSTSEDTNAFFKSKYPDLYGEGLEFVQNKVMQERPEDRHSLTHSLTHSLALATTHPPTCTMTGAEDRRGDAEAGGVGGGAGV